MQKIKLGSTGTHWLKTAHIVLATVWLGGAVAVVLGQYVLTAKAGLLGARWISVFKPWGHA